jgi:hypothetical protein
VITFGGEHRLLVYVYAPPWRQNSAGIKVLHYLVHLINTMGHDAWLVISNPKSSLSLSNPLLRTPILSQNQANEHFAQKRNPWVVYSETVPGNPLKANQVIRYLLNFPGNLGGPNRFDKSEYMVSYSGKIAESQNVPSLTLFIPVVDLAELPIPISQEFKKGSLIYAGKYRAFMGTPDLTTVGNAIEIFRDGPKAQSRGEVLALLNEAKQIYLFENSTIATEALLMGTVAIFVKNPFFNVNITDYELGGDGIGFLGDLASIDLAHATVDQYILRYERTILELPGVMKRFVKHFQEFSSPQTSSRPIAVPKKPMFFSRHRLNLFFSYWSNQGGVATFGLVTRYFESLFE